MEQWNNGTGTIEQWKHRTMEGWKNGKSNSGRIEQWNHRTMEEWKKNGTMEQWSKMEQWKNGTMKQWNN